MDLFMTLVVAYIRDQMEYILTFQKYYIKFLIIFPKGTFSICLIITEFDHKIVVAFMMDNACIWSIGILLCKLEFQ
jgi:hypothetical protein